MWKHYSPFSEIPFAPFRKGGIILGAVLAAAFIFTAAQSPYAATLTAGIQLADDSCSVGRSGGERFVSVSSAWSTWALDSNGFDPDCARAYLSGVSENVDFQVGIQLADGGSCGKELGAERWTPWASQGGGWSGWATDGNAFDPDCARISIKTRSAPDGMAIKGATLSIQAADDACTKIGPSAGTSLEDGWSGFISDTNGFDYDCLSLGLEVEREQLGKVQVQVQAYAADGKTLLSDVALKANWTLSGPNNFSKSETNSTGATYNRMSYGQYTISDVTKTVSQGDKTFELFNIDPASSRPLGETSPASCPAGQTNPHRESVNGVCQRVETCGVSICANVEKPNTGPQQGLAPSILRQLAGLVKIFLPQGLASCDPGGYCGGGTPPDPPTQPPEPPPPKEISFTLQYRLMGEIVFCRPETQTVAENTVTNFNVTGGEDIATFTWSAPSSSNPSQSGSSRNFTTSWSVTATTTFSVSVTNGRSTSTCRAIVSDIIGTITPPGSITCKARRDKILKGEQVTFDVTDATLGADANKLNTAGPYQWLAPGGAFDSATGASFTVSYADKGEKIVAVTNKNDKTAQCAVEVSEIPFSKSEIHVRSNMPTGWTMTGPANLPSGVNWSFPIRQTVATTSVDYVGAPGGLYVLIPDSITGYTVKIDPADSQSLLPLGGEITFNIVYTRQDPPERCTSSKPCLYKPTCSPLGSGTFPINSAIYFTASGGKFAGDDVTTTYLWTAASGDPQEGNGLQFNTKFNTVGEHLVTVKADNWYVLGSCSIIATADNPSSTLFVTLTANPETGRTPLDVDLTATVGGTAQGPISYAFWWDCGYEGADLTEAYKDTQCGDPDGEAPGNAAGTRYNNLSQGTKTVKHTYAYRPEGAYNPKVIVEREGQTAAAPAGTTPTIVVEPPDPLTCTPAYSETFVDSTVVLNATGGAEPYTWNAPYGRPRTGTGKELRTTYSSTGTKTVFLKDDAGEEDTCTIEVKEDDPEELACSLQYSIGETNSPFTFSALHGAPPYSWSAPGGDTAIGTGSEFTTSYSSLGEKTVVLQDSQNAEKECKVTVNPKPGGLSVSLTANPSYSYTPLASNLTAIVSGGGDGKIDYYLWKDCPVAGTSTTYLTNQCGAPETKLRDNYTLEQWDETYEPRVREDASVYKPKVVVKRPAADDGQWAEASAEVMVGKRENLSCAPPSQDRGLNTLATLRAFGGATPYSWSAPGGTTSIGIGDEFRTTYSAPGRKEITLTDRQNTSTSCTVDVGGNDGKHLTCVNKTCTLVDGEGQNGCTPEGSVCLDGPTNGEELSCTPLTQTKETNRLARFTASGGASPYSWSAPGGTTGFGSGKYFATAYGETGKKTVTLEDSSDAKKTCEVNVNAGPDGKHLKCGAGNICIAVDGEGEDECAPELGFCESDEQGGACSLTANPKIIRRGDSSMLNWKCKGDVTSCKIIGTGISGNADGPTTSSTVQPQKTTKYTLSCDGAEDSANVSIYVLQSYDETNPGGN